MEGMSYVTSLCCSNFLPDHVCLLVCLDHIYMLILAADFSTSEISSFRRCFLISWYQCQNWASWHRLCPPTICSATALFLQMMIITYTHVFQCCAVYCQYSQGAKVNILLGWCRWYFLRSKVHIVFLVQHTFNLSDTTYGKWAIHKNFNVSQNLCLNDTVVCKNTSVLDQQIKSLYFIIVEIIWVLSKLLFLCWYFCGRVGT